MGQLFFTPGMLIGKVREVTASFKDCRQGKNISYPVTDIFLSALSVFFMQSASFLAYQEAMEKKFGCNNARNLFGIDKIPTPEQIRNILDNYSPKDLFPIFTWCFEKLSEFGYLADFKTDLGYLIALDGTQYFSSDTIHCEDCLTKTDKKTDKVTYYHTVVTPVIVKPESEYVLSLIPEFIMPQDMADSSATEEKIKQDCEINASKRLLISHQTQALKDMEIIYLGDDLYAHEPFCRKVLGTTQNFIFVCKPESHKTVYDWIKGITKEVVVDRYDGKRHQIYTYSYIENVPLNDKKDSLLVNFVEVTVKDRVSGEQKYHNAFITSLPLEKDSDGVRDVAKATAQNLAAIVDCGRTRWKIENENNNTLKTKGYYFEHNYGHGKKYLSFILTTLILISFLFHTLLDLTNHLYQQVRSLIGSRVRFFNDLKTLTIYSCYKNFDHLFLWMYQALTKGSHLPNFSLPPPLMYTSS